MHQKVTSLATKCVVGRLHIHLQGVVVVAQVSEAFPHEDGLSFLADVNLVGVDVLDQVAEAAHLQVGLDVVALLKDVVSLAPAQAFPGFSHGFTMAGESLKCL